MVEPYFRKVETIDEAKRIARETNGCAWSNGAHSHFASSDVREGQHHLRFRADSMAVMLVQSFEPIVLPEPFDAS